MVAQICIVQMRRCTLCRFALCRFALRIVQMYIVQMRRCTLCRLALRIVQMCRSADNGDSKGKADLVLDTA